MAKIIIRFLLYAFGCFVIFIVAGANNRENIVQSIIGVVLYIALIAFLKWRKSSKRLAQQGSAGVLLKNSKVPREYRAKEAELRAKLDTGNADSLYAYAKWILNGYQWETRDLYYRPSFDEETINRACKCFIKAYEIGHETAIDEVRWGHHMRNEWFKYPLLKDYINGLEATEEAKKAAKAKAEYVALRDKLYTEAKNGDSKAQYLFAELVLWTNTRENSYSAAGINANADIEDVETACDMFFESFTQGNELALARMKFDKEYRIIHGVTEDKFHLFKTDGGKKDMIRHLRISNDNLVKKIRDFLRNEYSAALESGDANLQFNVGLSFLRYGDTYQCFDRYELWLCADGDDIDDNIAYDGLWAINGEIWIDDNIDEVSSMGLELFRAAEKQNHKKSSWILYKINEGIEIYEDYLRNEEARKAKENYERYERESAISAKINAAYNATFTMDGFGNKALANLESQYGISGVGRPSGGGSSSSSSRSASSSSSTGNVNPLFMAAGSEGDRIKSADSNVIGRHEGGIYKDASGTPRGRLVGDMFQDEHGSTIGWRAGNVILDAQSKQIGRIEGGVIKNDNSETIGRVE